MKIQDFDQKLEKYAELIVKVGLNLQPEQRLFLVAFSLDVAPLVRQVVKSVYKNGSRLVSVLWLDEQLDKIRYQYAPRDSFEEFPTWSTDGRLQCIERGDASLFIDGRNPELLMDQDPELVGIGTRTASKNLKPILDHLAKDSVQWSFVASPTPDWAAKVFPLDTPKDAVGQLWDAVFKVCRIDEPDPAVYWKRQVNNLEKRAKNLTEKQYSSLEFKGQGTNLSIGLPDGHIWWSGSGKTLSDISFLANLPTEEVYTLPHKNKIEGTVTATKPLNYQGNLIDNFSLTFSEGKVVNFSAEKGEETLRNLLENDEDAKSLGEVALVPHQSPISQLGFIFLNTLYDENASNHLALGNAYRSSLKGGVAMSDEEFAQAGGNDSLIHVDFMFGSGEMDVDGQMSDGATEPVMRAGEWAFDI